MVAAMFWQNVHQLDQQITLTINSWNSAFTDPIWTFLSLKLVWAPLYIGIIALMIWKLGWKKGLIVVGGVLLTIGFCDQFANLIKHATERIRPVNDEWMVAHGLNILEWGGGFSFFSAHAANSFGIAGASWLGLKKCLTCNGKASQTGIKDAGSLNSHDGEAAQSGLNDGGSLNSHDGEAAQSGLNDGTGAKKCAIQKICKCRMTAAQLCKYYAWIMYTWAALVGISRIFVGKHYLGDVIVGTLVGILAGLFFGWLSSTVANKYCARSAK